MLGTALAVLKSVGGGIAGAWHWARAHPVATPWILVAVLATVLVVDHLGGIRQLAAARAAGDARSAEEARQAAARLVVVKRQAQADVDAALAKVPDLEARVDAAQSEVGRLTVRYLIHAETAGAPVHAKPRPGEPPLVLAAGETPTPPVVLRMDDELVLAFDGAIVSGRAGAESLHALLSARRKLDGELLSRQPADGAVTLVFESEKAVCPAAPTPREVRPGLVGGGQAGPGGVGWLVGGQVLYRERWTVTAAGGPAGGVALAGFVF